MVEALACNSTAAIPTTTTATTEVHHAEIEANEDLKVAKIKVDHKGKHSGDRR